MANEFESLDNLDLIENSLDHIQYELKRSNIFYFRIGREAHLVLYRSLIEALKGTANLAISGHQSKTRQRIYHLGNSPWKEIHKIEIEGCNNAWRYSNPNICDDPEIDYSSINIHKDIEKHLISFYDALAMVQTECFMHRYIISKELVIPDDQMRILEWLHEEIRNEFEHFMPKSYMVHKIELCQVSILCLELSKELIFETKNVISAKNHSHIRIKIDELISLMNSFLAAAERDSNIT